MARCCLRAPLPVARIPGRGFLDLNASANSQTREQEPPGRHRLGPNDYDVLDAGKIIGRIMLRPQERISIWDVRSTPQKRTFEGAVKISALCQKRTSKSSALKKKTQLLSQPVTSCFVRQRLIQTCFAHHAVGQNNLVSTH